MDSRVGGAAARTAIEVVVGPDEVDLASGLLWGAGVTAIAEHPESTGMVRLRADAPRAGVAAVRAALGDRWGVAAVEVPDAGLDSWRDHARVVRAGRRLVVRPPWVPLGEVPVDAVVLEIDPEQSFGHGAHPTTRLCLAAVEDLIDARPGASVLDVGCGSGVLAVAAARLGAGRVVAVDVDPAAVAATRTNAARNGVADRIEVLTVPPAFPPPPPSVRSVLSRQEVGNGRSARQNGGGRANPTLLSRQEVGNVPSARQNGAGEAGVASMERPGMVPGTGMPRGGADGRFDVVVANIGARTLVELAPWLRDRTGDGGTLVLSGLLDPPPPDLAAAFAPFSPVEVRRMEGWVALLLGGGRASPR